MARKALDKMSRSELEAESARLAEEKVEIKRREAAANQLLDTYRALDAASIPPERLKQISLNQEPGDGEGKAN